MSKIQVAVQMYTVRDDAAKDFLGTFKKVAEIGYKGVELAGTNGMAAKDLKKFLDGLGLQVAGSHVGVDDFEKDFGKVADYYSELGVKHVAIPWLGEERRKDAAGWAKFGKDCNVWGGKLKERGITLCYHNHDFEFKKFDGQYGLDILYANADKANLQLELDLYWVQKGGDNPAGYMAKYPGRVPLVHAKDMAAGAEQKFAQVGSGILDWKAVFAAAPAAGVQWYVVEQDNCYDVAPLEAIKISFNNLKKMGVAG